ncbi:unnamed protein product [Cuscuta epithymum]|uniref:RING-type E3 ubiquitin transferase n=1 Tax=Cuscuta epithymum TaxID=186058 RepID=A0AAV0CB52_9ASTE|nr:unnamed protein product [Cuscuta epithymum]
MAATVSSSSSTLSVQNLLENIQSRRLLRPSTHVIPPPASSNVIDGRTAEPAAGGNALDENVVMVLSVLLCAFIFTLGLNSIVRSLLRCWNIIASGELLYSDPSARLANTGIKKKALKMFPTISYSSDDLKLSPSLDAECVICLSEFAAGERIRILPKCNHGFHVRCIDQWLTSHSSCPTCRHCLIDTCRKIAGCSAPAGASSSPPPPPERRIARMEPLPREGMVSHH